MHIWEVYNIIPTRKFTGNITEEYHSRKVVRARGAVWDVCCEIVSSIYERRTEPRKSQQYGYLK